jgi:hypothetical protein
VNDKSAALVGRHGVEPQRLPLAAWRGDLESAGVDGAGESGRHALDAATRLELLDGDGALDVKVAAKPGKQ